MTEKLRAAFDYASDLPPEQQEVLAAVLMEEIESEQRWSKAFAASPDALRQLAHEALEEHAKGKTLPLNPDQL